MKIPTTFISYAWQNSKEDEWVKVLASRLRECGVDAKLDKWELAPGDRLPLFMEQSIANNDFVIIVCTPKYKEKSNLRLGGVGYEGDLITSELLSGFNRRKFIPVLQSGDLATSVPNWLKGVYTIDLRTSELYEDGFYDLFATLTNTRESAPKLGNSINLFKVGGNSEISDSQKEIFNDIKMIGVVKHEVSTPINDGSRGSALYKIPIKLSSVPDARWKELFIQAWKHPSRFTLMHRPNIAKVAGDKIILDGSTMEELRDYHRETLKLAVNNANELYKQFLEEKKLMDEAEKHNLDTHRKNIDDISDSLSFDN